jgi:hypothetical protein
MIFMDYTTSFFNARTSRIVGFTKEDREISTE